MRVAHRELAMDDRTQHTHNVGSGQVGCEKATEGIREALGSALRVERIREADVRKRGVQPLMAAKRVLPFLFVERKGEHQI